jgi:hypothetical protein
VAELLADLITSLDGYGYLATVLAGLTSSEHRATKLRSAASGWQRLGARAEFTQKRPSGMSVVSHRVGCNKTCRSVVAAQPKR